MIFSYKFKGCLLLFKFTFVNRRVFSCADLKRAYDESKAMEVRLASVEKKINVALLTKALKPYFRGPDYRGILISTPTQTINSMKVILVCWVTQMRRREVHVTTRLPVISSFPVPEGKISNEKI